MEKLEPSGTAAGNDSGHTMGQGLAVPPMITQLPFILAIALLSAAKRDEDKCLHKTCTRMLVPA